MTRPPWLRRLTIAGVICAGLVVAFVAFLLFFQPTLNLKPFRHILEAHLTGLTGASITLDELHLKPSLQPTVEVRDLRAAELVSVETAELQIELIPLLKHRISIESLRLDQVSIQLRPAIDLLRDWSNDDDRPKSPYRIDALENLEFDRVQLNATDEDGGSHRLVIDELDGGITRSSPLRLEARGSFDGLALQLEAGGPDLEELFSPAAALPLVAALEMAGARLTLDGTLEKQPTQPALAIDFTLSGDDLQATLAAAELRAPSVGSFQLGGNLSHSGGPIQLSSLEGRIGETELSGELQLSFENERVALAGSLETGRIDLRPWLEASRPADDPDKDPEDNQRILDRPLPTEPVERALAVMDADLEMSIGGLEGFPTTVEGIEGRLILQDGQMALPYELELARSSVEGEVKVAGVRGLLELAFDLSSATFPLDQLTADLGKGLTTGTLGQLNLSASSSGETLGEMLDQLEIQLETGDAQIRFGSPDGERQVDLSLTRLELKRSPQVPVQMSLDGDLRGYPYHIELKGQASKDWESREPWPFKLSSEGLGGKTSIEGSVSFEPGDFFLELELAATGDRIGDLEPWWGVPADADYSYEAHGRLIVEPERRELHLDTLRVGQTTTALSLRVPPEKGSPILVDLDASTVAFDEVMSLIETEGKEIASEPVLTLDIPIWPEELPLPDARARLELDRVVRDSEELADFSNVVVDAIVSQSHLKRVAFSGRADEASYRGELDLDWATDPPEMSLDLSGESTDLGRLVPLEEVAPNLVVQAQRFDLDVSGAAETLRQMLDEGITISGSAEDVFVSVPFLDEAKPLELTLDQAEISEAPGQPVQVTADGHLWEWPVDLQLTLHNKDHADLEDNHFPVDMVLSMGDARLETKAVLTPPVTPDNLDLDFSLTAERVSSFEPFTGHRLSEVGPVAASGEFVIRPDNYALEAFSLEVGESDVNGKVSLDLTGGRPRLDADLSSQRVRLAELFAPTGAPNENQGETAEGSEEPERTSPEQEEESWLEKLQSSRLAKMDLDIDLQSEDIYWGGETGGGGQIQIRSEEGRLAIGPFHLVLADGSVEGTVLVQADSGLLDADIDLTVENVDYGPILRYLNPEAEGDGRIDLDTHLVTTSAPVGQLITEATGDLRFVLFPHDLDTTILDFWGSGLLRSMFGLVDPTNESVVNCIAGSFPMADGLMTAETFWFDTSRIRARGKGSIDLQPMTIDMTLRPRPKKRTFLSLATPAKIKGPLEDPSITLTKGGLVGTAFRIYMWWWTVYLQVFRKPLPRDGSDVCFLPPLPETIEPPTSEATSPPHR